MLTIWMIEPKGYGPNGCLALQLIIMIVLLVLGRI